MKKAKDDTQKTKEHQKVSKDQKAHMVTNQLQPAHPDIIKQHSKSRNQHLRRQEGGQILGTIFSTVLEIIEDKRDYQMPVLVYSAMVVVYMLQIGGYVFQSDAVENMTEEKMKTLAQISEISTGTFFLQLKGDDSQTIQCFALMQIILWVQILYILGVTFLKLFYKKWFQANRRIFKRPNQILNIYFMVYLWLILLPYIEVFSGFCNCGQFSYLSEYTDPANCDKKPKIFLILGVIGLILTIINSIVILFFYRSYEFNDSNILKRRFHPILLIQLFLYFIVIFFYYVQEIPISVKYIGLHCTGISYIYDSIFNMPYQNYFIARFYAASSICYEVVLIIVTIWVYNSKFHSDDLLYMCMIFSALLIAVYTSVWKYKYERIMRHASFTNAVQYFKLSHVLLNSLFINGFQLTLILLFLYFLFTLPEKQAICVEQNKKQDRINLGSFFSQLIVLFNFDNDSFLHKLKNQLIL